VKERSTLTPSRAFGCGCIGPATDFLFTWR
jgi:hypothetical protein